MTRITLPRDRAVLADHLVLAVTAGFALVALALLLWQSLGPDAGGGPRPVSIYGGALAASSVSSLVLQHAL
ncbi:MAG: hypothetical protein WDN69_18490 [Aliidongia sp.]